MAKKCLSCGNISDNNLYACSACLGKINDARRDLDLKRRFKKDTILVMNKIAPIFGIVMASVGIIFVLLVLNRFGLPTGVLLNILSFSAIGFLICFLLGTIVARYSSKFQFELYSDKDYYIQKPIERLKNIRLLKSMLKFVLPLCVYCLLAWLTLVALEMLLEVVYKFTLNELLLRLKYTVTRGFSSAGFILGLFTSFSKYFDWVKGLEK